MHIVQNVFNRILLLSGAKSSSKHPKEVPILISVARHGDVHCQLSDHFITISSFNCGIFLVCIFGPEMGFFSYFQFANWNERTFFLGSWPRSAVLFAFHIAVILHAGTKIARLTSSQLFSKFLVVSSKNAKRFCTSSARCRSRHSYNSRYFNYKNHFPSRKVQ